MHVMLWDSLEVSLSRDFQAQKGMCRLSWQGAVGEGTLWRSGLRLKDSRCMAGVRPLLAWLQEQACMHATRSQGQPLRSSPVPQREHS